MPIRMMTWPQSRNCRFQRELRLIQRFIKKTEENLGREYSELEAELHEECEGMDHEEAQSTWSSRSDEVFDLQVFFPAIHANMSFISLYSLLEHYLVDLCHSRQKECDYAIGVEDVHGKGIDAAKLYLTKVCIIEFPVHTSEWQKICDYRRLRNAIVHQVGQLRRGKDEDVRKVVAKYGIKTSFDQIELSYAFCFEVMNVFESFMTKATSAIQTDKQHP